MPEPSMTSLGRAVVTPPVGDRPARSRAVTDLVARARAGDDQAWSELVDRYAPLLWSICRRAGLSPADAADVAQNVWLALVRHLDDLRDPAALPGWLVTATRRECGRVLRLVAASRPPGGLDVEVMADEPAAGDEEELVTAERRAALRAAFADLPAAGQRLLTLLMAEAPLPYAQISAELDIPVGGIGPTRRRCLDKLRRHPAIAALVDGGPGSPV